jgi:hypothetical protein
MATMPNSIIRHDRPREVLPGVGFATHMTRNKNQQQTCAHPLISPALLIRDYTRLIHKSTTRSKASCYCLLSVSTEMQGFHFLFPETIMD